MAINFKDAQKIVDSGNAEHALGRFFQFVCRAKASGLDDSSGMLDDMMVISALLLKLLKTPEGKRTLRKNYRGKKYTPEKYGFPSPEMDIATELIHGVIDRKTALKKLSEQLELHRNEQPDSKTLERLLNDLEEQAESFLRNFKLMAMDSGFDGQDVGQLDVVLTEIMNRLGGNNHG